MTPLNARVVNLAQLFARRIEELGSPALFTTISNRSSFSLTVSAAFLILFKSVISKGRKTKFASLPVFSLIALIASFAFSSLLAAK